MRNEKAQVIGYIGLGLAGAPLAVNIARKGFKLVVRDANKQREDKFISENSVNVYRASANKDAFKDVDILITMLPNGHIVREVLFGKNGVAPFLKKGALVVDTSSSDPFGTKQLACDLQELGISLVDSPVTQIRMHGINDGEACFMLGGKEEDIEYALPVLKSMGKWWFYMGPCGSGHVMKTFNNYITGASIAALNDCFMVGAKMGLDPALITEVLNVGTGRNYGTAHSFRAEALTRTYNSGYGLALLVKDLGINLDLIKKVGVDSRLANLTHKFWAEALNDKAIEHSADYTKALVHWETKTGIKLPTYAGLTEVEEVRDEFYGQPTFQKLTESKL